MAGRKSHGAGKAAEDELQITHQVYLRRRLAWVTKTQPAAKPRKDGKMIYTKKGAPDYMGVVHGGQMVAFEVKSRKNNYFNFKSDMADHQLEDLRNAESMGAWAFWLLNDRERWGIITQERIDLLQGQGEKSVKLEDCYVVRPGKGTSCDWLRTAYAVFNASREDIARWDEQGQAGQSSLNI